VRELKDSQFQEDLAFYEKKYALTDYKKAKKKAKKEKEDKIDKS
jgi:hypothetical protein